MGRRIEMEFWNNGNFSASQEEIREARNALCAVVKKSKIYWSNMMSRNSMCGNLQIPITINILTSTSAVNFIVTLPEEKEWQAGDADQISMDTDDVILFHRAWHKSAASQEFKYPRTGFCRIIFPTGAENDYMKKPAGK